MSLATPASAAVLARHHLVCTPVIEAPEAGGFCIDSSIDSAFDSGCAFGSMAAHALQSVLEAVHSVDAICCGPGLTLTPHTIAFVGEVLHYAASKSVPLLLDADALNALAANPTMLPQLGSQESPLVLTPHAGELARLSNAFLIESTIPTKSVASGKAPVTTSALRNSVTAKSQAQGKTSAPDEFNKNTAGHIAHTAEALALKLNAIVVAKGQTTYIAGNGQLVESSEATPALAKAGTGDVLAGIISSFIAQGVPAREAAIIGVRVHSKAGILAEEKQGRRSVTALDVLAVIPSALKCFEHA